MSFKKFFHLISYLQYPLMFTGLYFSLRPFIIGIELVKEDPSIYFENVNLMLIFVGLGINFSALQDTSKTQNKLSRKIYEDPIKGKIFLLIIMLMMGGTLGAGLIGYFSTEEKSWNDLSVGLIILALGMFGFLKAGAEMFEHHRLDKKG